MATKTKRPKILLVDQQRMAAQGIAELLAKRYDVSLSSVSNGIQLIRDAKQSAPDLIVLADVALPCMSGIEAVRRLRQAMPGTPLLFLAAYVDSPLMRAALGVGANGCVAKDVDVGELCRAVEKVLGHGFHADHGKLQDGRPHLPGLTPRQHTILRMLSTGLTSRRIAENLKVSVRTVEVHRQALMHAFGVHNSVELVQLAAKTGFV